MMIRILLFPLLSFSCLWAEGEAAEPHYKFLLKTEAYQPLSEANQVQTGLEFSELQLPFHFSFFDVASRSLTLSQTGSVDFEAGWLYAFEGNFKPYSHGNSGIFYTVSGSAPNRILKVEWRNFTAYELSEKCCNINFQVWLLEADCSIEIHFGNTFLGPKLFDEVFGPGATGPRVGLFRSEGPGVLLSGETENPTVKTRGFHMLNGIPTTGCVYRFIPTQGTAQHSENSDKANQLNSAQVFIGLGSSSHFQTFI